MHINLHNVEQLIFSDNNLRKLLPEFQSLFDSWKVAQLSPALRTLGKRSILDFLNGLENPHIDRLETYFGEVVTVDKLDYHIVRNINCDIDDAELVLDQVSGYVDMTAYRDGEQLYISLWR
jgi:hypothetical protein